MNFPGRCYRCGQPGHVWTECQRPPAKTRTELHTRINDITQRWDAGQGGFGRAVKVRLIEIERRNYEKARGK